MISHLRPTYIPHSYMEPLCSIEAHVGLLCLTPATSHQDREPQGSRAQENKHMEFENRFRHFWPPLQRASLQVPCHFSGVQVSPFQVVLSIYGGGRGMGRQAATQTVVTQPGHCWTNCESSQQISGHLLSRQCTKAAPLKVTPKEKLKEEDL